MRRPPLLRASYGDLVVDNFAGGGGASTGIADALGRPVDVAINHDEAALAMHAANHPTTRHVRSNILEVDPREVCGGRQVGDAWFSPDCTEHSRAKGGKPRNRGTRSLAWVVVDWARLVRPLRMFLENVEEFEDWGPLDEHDRPDPVRRGETFRQFVAALIDLGYAVEWRSLVAADYGAPTTRRRLFMIARCDGKPIVWPEASHGRGRALAWRTAASIIDWSLPCPSIFERARPLADATNHRVAVGVRRFVLESGDPFIVPIQGHGLVAPTLIQTGYGERKGQAPRALDLGKPLGTVVAGGQKHALVAAFLTKHYGGVIGHGVQRPIGVVTTKDHHALTCAFLTKFYGTSIGCAVQLPLPTVTANDRGGGHLAEVRAFLVKYYGAGGGAQTQMVWDPLHTVTTRARFGLVVIGGESYEIADLGMRMLGPRELFRAMAFPDTYEIAPMFHGKPLTKTVQIEKAGNSVPPVMARAIVAANARAA